MRDWMEAGSELVTVRGERVRAERETSDREARVVETAFRRSV